MAQLFIFSDGIFLSRKHVVAFLHISLPDIANIQTHSFRIGGTSTATPAGASDSMIREMGKLYKTPFSHYPILFILRDHQLYISTRVFRANIWLPARLLTTFSTHDFNIPIRS